MCGDRERPCIYPGWGRYRGAGKENPVVISTGIINLNFLMYDFDTLLVKTTVIGPMVLVCVQ